LLFESPLIPGILVQRYKRFFADVRLATGEVVTAHCPNTGSMLGCKEPGSRVWLSESDNPHRKLRYTWELVEAKPGVLVGVHTGRANRLVEEAVLGGVVPELAGYGQLRREVKFGVENSRVDLLLGGHGLPDCYVEVKNVTAAVEHGIALFPDAVSERGTKHLRELMHIAGQGHRAAIFFCTQREDVTEVRPADEIDPVYGRTLREAGSAGVLALAYRAEVGTTGVVLNRQIDVVLPGSRR
jgi:sugar fermentation stimulation protein A